MNADVWRVWIRSSLAVWLLAAILLLAGTTQLTMSVSSVVLEINGVADTAISSLPISQQFTGRADIHLTLQLPRFGGSLIRIVPDETLVQLDINDQPFDLHGISSNTLSDWKSGFTLDLSRRLLPGSNRLHFAITNLQGAGGLKLEYQPIGVLASLPYLAIVTGLAIIFMTLAKRLALSRSLLALGIISIALVVLYWFQTPYAMRQFDILEGGGHLDYIRYLTTHWRLPPPDAGWEYHQPPLYYLSAVPAYLLGQLLPQIGWQTLLRVVSAGYWLLFIASGLAIIQLYLQRWPVTMLLTGFAFCCWPAGFMHSIRTGNDVAFYAWYTCGLLATCRWWQNNRHQHFGYAIVCCGLAILSKSNGLALGGIIATLLFAQWLRASHKIMQGEAMQQLWRCSCQLALVLAVTIGISFHSKLSGYMHGTSSDWLLASVGNTINSGLRVTNTWAYFFGFDLRTFLDHNWLSAWDDATGRQYFWNYLLRSAISSEFAFDARLNRVAATSGVLLLLLCIGVMIRLMRFVLRLAYVRSLFWLRNPWRLLPILLNGFMLIALLMAYRFKAPYASNTDFRYVYPALLSLLVVNASQAYRPTLALKVVSLAAPALGLMGVLWVLLL